MKKIYIIYGSTTGNTEEAAKKIAEQLKNFAPVLKNVSNCEVDDFTTPEFLILGTSTWGAGDLQDDWYNMLEKLQSTDLSSKTLALFGLGDSDTYSDTFVDGMAELYEFFKNKGCKIVGSVDTDGYSYENSRAVVNDEFVGLPINADSESNLTDERIANWIVDIKKYLN